jgi:hypothetical protein
MGFFVCFFIVFCIGYCLERLDHRKRAKRWKSVSVKVNNRNAPCTEEREESHRKLLNTFGDGVFEVGVDIAHGTYRSLGGDPTFPTIWHRLSDFTGTGIIAEGGCAGPCIVTILESDRGFESLNSGGWTLVGQ